MKIQSLIFIFLLLGILKLSGQSTVNLSHSAAQEDLDWLRYSLEYTHPRLYKYDDKKTVDQRFDQAYQHIQDSISGLDFLGLVSQLNASVNCGHLYTIPQAELRQEILDKKVMPFYLKLVGDALHIFYDCSEEGSIPNGSKLIAINGKSASQIYELMLLGIASDGYITTRKKRLIESYLPSTTKGFDLYYFLHVDRSLTFDIEYEDRRNKEIKRTQKTGISANKRKLILQQRYSIDQDAWLKKPSPTWLVDAEQDCAVLGLPRSFFDDKIDPNFDSLLQVAFQELKDMDINNLIIDLRNNEGGSEHHQMELMSYLYDQAFKLYQNILQSHLDWRPLKEVIMERDTTQLLFNNDDEYMRKLSNGLWINNYEYSKNLQLQAPKANVFQGNLYVLINGGTFSSGSDLAANIRKTTDAIFIGEESGGTFEGPTGGISIVVQLPNSKIMVRISPNIQIGSLYRKHPIGRGVLPDHEVVYTVEDLLYGKDLEMEKALELIRAGK